MTRLRNLNASAGRWGWPKALANLLAKRAARNLGVHVYKIRVRPLANDIVANGDSDKFVVRRIKPDELIVLCEDAELDLAREFVDAAVRRGDQAFGVFDGALLVSYIWRSLESAPDADGVWIRICKPYNYSYKAFTRRRYRGQKISPAAFLFSDDAMRKLGYKFRVGIVGITNYASLGMSKHTDSVIVGHAAYLAWFGKVFTFRSAAVKAIGLEFFRPTETD